MGKRIEDERAPELVRVSAMLDRAARDRKCWPCGCFHDALEAITTLLPARARRGPIFDKVLALSFERRKDRRYEYLGCLECHPAEALDLLRTLGLDPTQSQPGFRNASAGPAEDWPALPGEYTVLRRQAPVALCTLADRDLADAVTEASLAGVSIIGTLESARHGLERLVTNVATNPHLRFLLVCGRDRREAPTSPGRALLNLVSEGVDEEGRIRGIDDPRAAVPNLSPQMIEAFRRGVELIHRVGITDLEEIARTVAGCVERDPGPRLLAPEQDAPIEVEVTPSPPPTLDEAGYFVIHLDRSHGQIVVEHYHRDGRLNQVLRGRDPAALYEAAVERELLCRLDHAAYLGYQLARAEDALSRGTRFLQGAAAGEEAADASSRSSGRSAAPARAGTPSR